MENLRDQSSKWDKPPPISLLSSPRSPNFPPSEPPITPNRSSSISKRARPHDTSNNKSITPQDLQFGLDLEPLIAAGPHTSTSPTNFLPPIPSLKSKSSRINFQQSNFKSPGKINQTGKKSLTKKSSSSKLSFFKCGSNPKSYSSDNEESDPEPERSRRQPITSPRIPNTLQTSSSLSSLGALLASKSPSPKQELNSHIGNDSNLEVASRTQKEGNQSNDSKDFQTTSPLASTSIRKEEPPSELVERSQLEQEIQIDHITYEKARNEGEMTPTSAARIPTCSSELYLDKTPKQPFSAQGSNSVNLSTPKRPPRSRDDDFTPTTSSQYSGYSASSEFKDSPSGIPSSRNISPPNDAFYPPQPVISNINSSGDEMDQESFGEVATSRTIESGLQTLETRKIDRRNLRLGRDEIEGENEIGNETVISGDCRQSWSSSAYETADDRGAAEVLEVGKDPRNFSAPSREESLGLESPFVFDDSAFSNNPGKERGSGRDGEAFESTGNGLQELETSQSTSKFIRARPNLQSHSHTDSDASSQSSHQTQGTPIGKIIEKFPSKVSRANTEFEMVGLGGKGENVDGQIERKSVFVLTSTNGKETMIHERKKERENRSSNQCLSQQFLSPTLSPHEPPPKSKHRQNSPSVQTFTGTEYSVAHTDGSEWGENQTERSSSEDEEDGKFDRDGKGINRSTFGGGSMRSQSIGRNPSRKGSTTRKKKRAADGSISSISSFNTQITSSPNMNAQESDFNGCRNTLGRYEEPNEGEISNEPIQEEGEDINQELNVDRELFPKSRQRFQRRFQRSDQIGFERSESEATIRPDQDSFPGAFLPSMSSRNRNLKELKMTIPKGYSSDSSTGADSPSNTKVLGSKFSSPANTPIQEGQSSSHLTPNSAASSRKGLSYNRNRNSWTGYRSQASSPTEMASSQSAPSIPDGLQRELSSGGRLSRPIIPYKSSDAENSDVSPKPPVSAQEKRARRFGLNSPSKPEGRAFMDSLSSSNLGVRSSSTFSIGGKESEETQTRRTSALRQLTSSPVRNSTRHKLLHSASSNNLGRLAYAHPELQGLAEEESTRSLAPILKSSRSESQLYGLGDSRVSRLSDRSRSQNLEMDKENQVQKPRLQSRTKATPPHSSVSVESMPPDHFSREYYIQQLDEAESRMLLQRHSDQKTLSRSNSNLRSISRKESTASSSDTGPTHRRQAPSIENFSENVVRLSVGSAYSQSTHAFSDSAEGRSPIIPTFSPKPFHRTSPSASTYPTVSNLPCSSPQHRGVESEDARHRAKPQFQIDDFSSVQQGLKNDSFNQDDHLNSDVRQDSQSNETPPDQLSASNSRHSSYQAQANAFSKDYSEYIPLASPSCSNECSSNLAPRPSLEVAPNSPAESIQSDGTFDFNLELGRLDKPTASMYYPYSKGSLK